MRRFSLALTLFGVTLASPVWGQTSDLSCPGTCVEPSDMKVFLESLREKKCLKETAPTVQSDPIEIVIDQEGHVFGSGSGPKPFTVHLSWCNYTLEAAGQTQIVVGQQTPSTYGFHFRPKASIGLLGTELLIGSKVEDSVDVGVLLDPFYFLTHFNVNLYVGVRSVGAGLGYDLTHNVGVYGGYAATWSQLRGNPMIGLYFSLW